MLSEDLMKDARLRFEDAMCNFQRREVVVKSFQIFEISVSVTAVALHSWRANMGPIQNSNYYIIFFNCA